MSFVAGVVSLSGVPLPPGVVAQFRTAMPPGEPGVESVAAAGELFVHVDLGAFGASGVAQRPGGVALIAGDPLLEGEKGEPGRGALRMLSLTDEERRHLLRGVNGNFAAALLSRPERRLVLIADRLGARPLYWWTDGRIAAFSSTLDLLERLPFVVKAIDIDGLLERAQLGYSLGDHTPYLGIRRMLAGEEVAISLSGTSRTHYWRWSALQEQRDLGKLSTSFLAALRAAVGRRLGGRATADAFLSGGLDSRVVNQLLHDAGARVRSYCFSPVGSMDAVFARLFADALGTEHHDAPFEYTAGLRFAAVLAQARRASAATSSKPEVGLEPAWSGDGGSVCGGFVYVTPTIIEAARRGDTDAVAAEHFRNHGTSLAARDLHPAARLSLDGRVQRSIRDAIGAYRDVADPARRFFLFLVENDQRRHLDHHFEGILEHRQEMVTPFYDGAFLEQALSVPVDAGLGHGFYARWFDLLPAVARSTPWQAYPGHVPCPVPIPAGLRYQWEGKPRRHTGRMRIAAQWLTLLTARDFPSAVLRRGTLALRSLRHVLGLRDEGPTLRAAESLRRFWGRSIPPPPA